MLTRPFILYMAAWGLANLLAVYLMVRYRHSLELFRAPYWRFLLQEWKVLSFIVAANRCPWTSQVYLTGSARPHRKNPLKHSG